MILLPATTQKITTLADGSWRISFDLGELSPDQLAELSKVVNMPVALGIALGEFTRKEKEALSEAGKPSKEPLSW